MIGGNKRGPGRPPGSGTDETKTELMTFRCTVKEKRAAEKIGSGNASKGIRLALRQWEYWGARS